jgi:hypothetical protein
MIPFEDLVAALDAYVARTRGGSASSASSQRMPAGGYDPPTTEHTMPPVEASLRSHGDEDATMAGAGPDGEPGGVRPIYDDRSNELDIGDVLDEDPT